MKTESILAWHFVGDKLRNGAPIPADGVTLRFRGRLIMCESGFHASRRIIDALSYAPGDTVCRVLIGGETIEEPDKLVASERSILWRLDAKELLLEFTRKIALSVIHLWDAPDVVKRYLETGDPKQQEAAFSAASKGYYLAGATYSYASVYAAGAAAAACAASAASAAAAACSVMPRIAAYKAVTARYAAHAATRSQEAVPGPNSVNDMLTKMVEDEHEKIYSSTSLS